MTDTTLSDHIHGDKTTPSIWPGLALAALIAALALALRYLPGVGMLSPLILAIFLGMALRNTLGTPEVAKAGLAISMRPVLRAGIILMGLQLTLGQVAAVGWVGVAVIALSLVLTFGFTTWLGRVLGGGCKADAVDRGGHVDLRGVCRDRNQYRHPWPRRRRRLCGGLRDDFWLALHDPAALG
ncbi:hypothetical protein Sulfitobl28_32960 (plasmid) [Sulfitobacter pontiacus]|nr:hypothetical protein Sulfitobl28_32960 [Sulfitobacter pontiacus]